MVVVDDAPPAGLTFVSAGAPCAGGFPCALGAIAAGASKIVTATFAIAPTYSQPDPILNNATATAATLDPVSSNNTGGWASALLPALANLSVTKTRTPAGAVTPGELVTYTVTVTNTGPSAGAANVVLSDSLPPELAFVSLAAPPGWNCLTPDPEVSGTISCTRSLVPLGSFVFSIVVRVTSAAAGTVGNSVTIESTTDDAATSDDTTAEVLAVNVSADLRVTKTGPAQLGGVSQIVYQIDVTNLGPSDAQGVVITDPTPPGLTLVSVSTPCAGGFPCAIGTLAAGETVRIEASYSVLLPLSSTNPIRNVATVASTTADPDSANNSAAMETEVAPPAIPTMAEWALLILALVLVWFGLRRIHLHSQV